MSNLDQIMRALADVKAGGEHKINVPALMTLVFAGGFDEHIDPPEAGGRVKAYKEICQRILTATKSKASLPKAKKTDVIGLAGVTNEIQLELWRSQANAVYRRSFLPHIHNFLTSNRFEPREHAIFQYSRIVPIGDNKNQTELLTDNWSEVFEKYALSGVREGQEFFQKMGKGVIPLYVPCIILKSDKRAYGSEGKKRLVVEAYCGLDTITGLTLWPNRDGRLNAYLVSTMTPMQFGLLKVRPNIWNGNYGGTIDGWEPIYLTT